MGTPSSSISTTYLVFHADEYSLLFYQHNLPGSPRWQVLHPLLSVSAPLTWFSLLMGTPSSSISLSTTYLVFLADGYSLLFYQSQHHLHGYPHWQVLPPLLPPPLMWFSMLTGTPSSSIRTSYLSLHIEGTPSSSTSTTCLVLHADGYSLLFYQHHLPGPPCWWVLPPLLSALLTWFSMLTGTPSSSTSTTYLVLHIDVYSLFYQHHLPGSPHWQVLPPLLSVLAPLTWFSTLTGTPSSSISFSTTYLVLRIDGYSLLFYQF